MAELDRYYLPQEKQDFLTEEAARALIEKELRSYSSQFGIGAGNQIFKATNLGIQLGHALFSSAPFRVTMAGALTATSATISGTITATTGAIGGFDIGTDYIRDAANSFGLASTVTGSDDVRFWAGATFASRATAPARITEAGAATFTSATVTGAITTSAGSSLDGQYLTAASVVSSKVNASIRSWSVTSAFSASDTDTVAWGAGSLILSDGTSYSITGSNTGNMSARTYIYFDSAVSTTAFQTTTTASTAVGDGKILVATAVNNTNEATFEVFGGVGGMNVDGSSIVALSITASEIAANTITANKLSVSQLSAITADLGAITAGTIVLPSGGFIRSGQTAYDSGTGFYLGNDSGTPKFSIGNSGGRKFTWDGTTLAVDGSITTASGSVLNGTYVTDNTITSAKVNVAARGWTQTSAFSVTDSDTVAWGAGTFTASDGTAYSIGASNTGNMAAKTYIYLDIAVSTTAYQTTTTASTAVGDGKVLIAVAQNNTTEATFQVFGGNGGLNIDAASIVASSITANEIAASTITAGKLSITTLSAITANMGTITAGTITLDTSGYIRGGQTDYNTGTGFFLGYSGGAYKLSIGDASSTNSLTWDGSILTVNGSTVSGNDIFGSGADGAFALDGTNTYTNYMSKSGSDYTLTKDVFATTFTMSSTATLTMAGYRLFAKTSLTTGASNVIKWNGGNGGNGGNGTTGGASGAGGSAGTALTSTNLFGGVAGIGGGAGGAANSAGVAGTAGVNVTNSFALTAHSTTSAAGGNGGDDGLGNTGGSGAAAGAAGSITSASSVRPYSAAFAIRMYDELPGASLAYLRYQNGVGGGGGGGGGKSGSGAATGGPGGGGGGSGSSGGTMVIAARTISHSGSITSTGGNGGNGGTGADAAASGGGAGGGGGGGGGAGTGGPGGQVICVYSSLSGSGTITAAGGTAGSAGSGGLGSAGPPNGTNGSNGSAGSTGPSGVVVQLQV